MSSISPTLIAALRDIVPGGVEADVSLREISRWRIGGQADVIVRPRTIDELVRLRAWIARQGLAHVVIGGTTNLLFSDAGLRVICVQIGGRFARFSIEGQDIIAGPGVWVPGLARSAMLAGLAGLEHTCGIPGTLGGLICMNGGSQRKGIGEVVETITSVDTAGNIQLRTREACDFAYRHSIFQDGGEVIAEVRLRLQKASDRQTVRRTMLGILVERKRKFPQKMPNCGSVFVSDPAMYEAYGPPGAVIERLGFKGLREGGAIVSEQHANFILNEGSAAASDVLALIGRVRSAVAAETGYQMKVEARFVSEDGVIVPADEAVPERLAGRFRP